MRPIAQMRGNFSLQSPFHQTPRQLLEQTVLPKDVLRITAILQQFIQQGILSRCLTGHYYLHSWSHQK
jgi:hypothetical protein